MKTQFTKLIMEDAFGCSLLEFDFESGIHNVGGLNGAGKSTIYLGLSQGLFNKNPKGVKIDDVSNIITGLPYRITVLFNKGSDSYKIVNSRKSGTITIEMNGKSLTRKTIPQNLELIREIIGDTYETFVSMTYQSTESTLDLVEENSDTARKGFINKILKFDELDELLAESKDKLKQLKLILKGKVSQMGSLESGLLPIREVGTLLDVSKLEGELTDLEFAKDNAASEMQFLEQDIKDMSLKAEEYSAYLNAKYKADKLKKELDLIKLPNEDMATIQLRISELQKAAAEHRVLRSQNTTKLMQLKEPELTCSRCGHEVSSKEALERYEKDKKEASDAIAYHSERITELEGEAWFAKEQLADWEQYNKYKEELSSINFSNPPEPFEPENLYALRERMAQEKAKYSKASEDYIYKVKEVAEAKGKNELVQMVAKFNDEAIANNEGIRNRLNSLQEEVGGIEHRIELVEMWTRILGSNGYRVHRMSKFLAVLNQIMTKYSDIISGGKIKCSFYLSEEGKIEFKVVDADKSIPFSGWSGGEKSRVKLACLFAVLEILEIMGSASYNVLFLDEVFATLDEGGREGLFEVLAHLKSTGKCIYTVSHTPIANAVVFDSSINVVKENGISRIV